MVLETVNHKREHKENRLKNKLKPTKYSDLGTPSTLIVTSFAKKKKKVIL